MAYRKRTQMSRKMAALRAAKERRRIEGPAPDYPPELPALRRLIIVIDYDHGKVVHRLDLYRCDRIDCYRVVADGQPWKDRIGWSKIVEAIRKNFTRLGSSS